MFTESNRIIVVDNSQEDLDRIAREFNFKGIGCRTILYDGVNFPEKPFSDVRVAFFDVNLGQSFSDNEKYAILENAIESYISIDNGPFVLIFWTNNAKWKDGFIDFVNRDPESKNIVRDRIKPYYLSVIDKTSISEKNTLESMLREQMGNQLVELCLNFDDQLKVASDKTYTNLLAMVPIGKTWGNPDMFEEGLVKLFSKIAISSWGLGNAKANPDGAINEAVIPVVAHSIPQKRIWDTFLNGYLNQLTSDKEIFPKGDNVIFQLNNFFLVDENKVNIRDRGIVVTIKPDLFEKYFGIDFPSWKKNEFGESDNIKNAFPIAVEISAACDYCQQNKRTYKYIMGIASGNNIPNRGKINILLTEALFIKKKPMYVAFDLNYVFVDIEPSIIDSVLFGFKKEMMDMIGNRYANHISRIGITSFK